MGNDHSQKPWLDRCCLLHCVKWVGEESGDMEIHQEAITLIQLGRSHYTGAREMEKETLLRIWQLEDKCCNWLSMETRNIKNLNSNHFHLIFLTEIHWWWDTDGADYCNERCKTIKIHVQEWHTGQHLSSFSITDIPWASTRLHRMVGIWC